MTCNFFTIIKNYFTCCNSNKKENEPTTPTTPTQTLVPYYLDSYENNPYTFDDASLTSNESSSSSLDNYNLSQQQQKQLKESIQQLKKYNHKLIHNRHYSETYETTAW